MQLRAAVRSVLRCLLRHSRQLDPDLSGEIMAQFKRRKYKAKTGHIKAAYTLEERLRQVHLGTAQLADVRREFTKQKPPKPAVELNAQGKLNRWLKQPERRLDAYNYPPKGIDKQRVHEKALLANRRALYLKAHGLSPHEVDNDIVDTVFAPAWRRSFEKVKNAKDEERRKTPQSVGVYTVTRTSGQLSVLRVQGRRQRLKGFLQHVKRVDKDLDLGSISKLPRDKKEKVANHFQRLEVHRRILLRRRDEIARRLNYEHRRRAPAKEPKKLRLWAPDLYL